MLLKFQKRAIRPGRFAALIAEPGRTGTLEPTGTVVLELAPREFCAVGAAHNECVPKHPDFGSDLELPGCAAIATSSQCELLPPLRGLPSPWAVAG